MVTMTVSEAQAQAAVRKLERDRKERKRQKKRFKAARSALQGLLAAPQMEHPVTTAQMMSKAVYLADMLLVELDKP